MPTWRNEKEACSSGLHKRYGKKLTYQMCENWAGNDPNDCKNNAPTGTVGWQKCALGSSPKGIEYDASLMLCSDPVDNFDCEWGQNCFAITKEEMSWECVINEILSISACCCCCIILIFILSLLGKSKKGRGGPLLYSQPTFMGNTGRAAQQLKPRFTPFEVRHP